MKIQAIKSQENKSDILELSGNILKINGKPFDLDNLLSPSIEDDADNTQFFIDNQCYIDNGIKQLKIYVSQEHFFLFVNNNYLLFHDKDLNGEIDIVELADLIRCYNLSEEDILDDDGNVIEKGRRTEHKEYRDSFSAEDWKIRMETCNQNR